MRQRPSKGVVLLCAAVLSWNGKAVNWFRWHAVCI